MAKVLQLSSPETFYYLNQSGVIEADGIDDGRQSYTRTQPLTAQHFTLGLRPLSLLPCLQRPICALCCRRWSRSGSTAPSTWLCFEWWQAFCIWAIWSSNRSQTTRVTSRRARAVRRPPPAPTHQTPPLRRSRRPPTLTCSLPPRTSASNRLCFTSG
jgi:hypothetical protein